MNDRVALLLPTRGRPSSLRRLIDSIDATVARPDDVVVVIGVDDDDAATLALAARLRSSVAILGSVGPRETTLGRLWNRLAAADHGCDVLAMLTDDYVMATPGWDDLYRRAAAAMPMGYGTAWPHDPMHGRDFCTAPVITRRMMERLGFFVPPWFPFWFHDVWLEEMGAYVGCALPLDVLIAAPEGRGRTQNLRDLAFWAALFDATRPLRTSLAVRMIDEMHTEHPDVAASLKHDMAGVARFYARRNRKVAGRVRSRLIEWLKGTRGDPGPRYRAARREAEALLASLGGASP